MIMRSGVLERAVLAAALLAAWPADAAAGFSDGLSSAASEGSGNAGAASAPEAGSLFVNPGGLARLDRGDLTLMYARPLSGIPEVSLNQGVAAVAVPAGMSWTLAAGARYFDDAGLSREVEGAVGASRRFGALSVGAAGVFLQRSYDVGAIPGAASDPVFAGGSSNSGVGLDAGARYEVSERLSLGIAGRNLNRPDLGLVGEDRVPSTWRAGGSYRAGRLALMAEARGKSESAPGDAEWGAGAEFRAAGPLLLRAGAEGEQVSAGMGVSFRDLRLDYAFSFASSLGAGEGGNHRMSVGYRFGEGRTAPLARADGPRKTENVRWNVQGAAKRVYRPDEAASAKKNPVRRIRPLD